MRNTIYYLMTILSVVAIITVLNEPESDKSCQELVKKVSLKEPGIDHVDNIRRVNVSRPIILPIPGEVKMTCTGNTTFTSGEKSFSHFYQIIGEDKKEIVYFEPDIIINMIRETIEKMNRVKT